MQISLYPFLLKTLLRVPGAFVVKLSIPSTEASLFSFIQGLKKKLKYALNRSMTD